MPRHSRAKHVGTRGHVDRGEDTSKIVVEQADEFGVDRNVDSPGQLIDDHVEQSTDGHRGQAEHDDLGKPVQLGQPDRVAVARRRRINGRVGRHRFERPSLGLDHPIDLLGMGNAEVRQLRRR